MTQPRASARIRAKSVAKMAPERADWASFTRQFVQIDLGVCKLVAETKSARTPLTRSVHKHYKRRHENVTCVSDVELPYSNVNTIYILYYIVYLDCIVVWTSSIWVSILKQLLKDMVDSYTTREIGSAKR